MLNIGFGELAVICILLIVVVGPQRLPTVMRSVGKTLRGLRQASRDIRTAVGIDELMREDFQVPAPRPKPVSKPVSSPVLAADGTSVAALPEGPVSRQDELVVPQVNQPAASHEAAPTVVGPTLGAGDDSSVK
jgi:Tat protein translocase TatB subunit